MITRIQKSELSELALPLAVMALLWVLVPTLVHSAPPMDVVESAVWGREWMVGTYKHPAMPAWVLEIIRALSGGTLGWTAYLAGQLFNLATLLLTFYFARDVAGPRVAAAAVLALLGVEYFSWRSPEFNHTQAQMPFWIGSAWAAWRAVETRALGWWLLLGALAAAGLYGKLSNATLLVVIAGWILATPQGRATLRSPGPYLGAALFALVCVPLVQWLLASHFQALAYAEARGREQTLAAMLLFPVNTLLQGAPIILVLALAGFFAARRPPVAPAAVTPHLRRFLLAIACGPAALSVVLALVGGSGLRAAWLAPSLPLMAVAAIALNPARVDAAVLRRLGRIGLACAVVLPLAYAAVVPQLWRVGTVPTLRVNWPQATIAQSLASAWREATDKPLRIVAGRAWPAGLVALNHPDRPSIFTEGDFAFAPWITPERLARDGALFVWSEQTSAGLTEPMRKLIADRPVQERRIAAPRTRSGADIIMKFVIVPPA